jgi:hypothetical protein
VRMLKKKKKKNEERSRQEEGSSMARRPAASTSVDAAEQLLRDGKVHGDAPIARHTLPFGQTVSVPASRAGNVLPLRNQHVHRPRDRHRLR